MYNFVTCKVCYHVLVVTFPMPHDRGCEIKIIVIVIVIVIGDLRRRLRLRCAWGWLVQACSAPGHKQMTSSPTALEFILDSTSHTSGSLKFLF